jgi:hypothetical protein
MRYYQKITNAFILAILLSGCARPELEFKKEPLTGQEYCVASDKLLPLKNSENGSLSLKYAKGSSVDKASIKATLYIAQNGREYNINPHETFTLFIDGIPYALNIVNSFQDPLEVINHHSAYLPSGATLRFGTVKEITRRQMSFFLPLDYLSKMIAAKRVAFEISSPSTGSSFASQGYPITLELSKEGISFLQEFKNKCINNFLNQSGVDK